MDQNLEPTQNIGDVTPSVFSSHATHPGLAGEQRSPQQQVLQGIVVQENPLSDPPARKYGVPLDPSTQLFGCPVVDYPANGHQLIPRILAPKDLGEPVVQQTQIVQQERVGDQPDPLRRFPLSLPTATLADNTVQPQPAAMEPATGGDITLEARQRIERLLQLQALLDAGRLPREVAESVASVLSRARASGLLPPACPVNSATAAVPLPTPASGQQINPFDPQAPVATLPSQDVPRTTLSWGHMQSFMGPFPSHGAGQTAQRGQPNNGPFNNERPGSTSITYATPSSRTEIRPVDSRRADQWPSAPSGSGIQCPQQQLGITGAGQNYQAAGQNSFRRSLSEQRSLIQAELLQRREVVWGQTLANRSVPQPSRGPPEGGSMIMPLLEGKGRWMVKPCIIKV